MEKRDERKRREALDEREREGNERAREEGQVRVKGAAEERVVGERGAGESEAKVVELER